MSGGVLHGSRLLWRMQNGMNTCGKGGNWKMWNSSQEKAADASTNMHANLLKKLRKV